MRGGESRSMELGGELGGKLGFIGRRSQGRGLAPKQGAKMTLWWSLQRHLGIKINTSDFWIEDLQLKFCWLVYCVYYAWLISCPASCECPGSLTHPLPFDQLVARPLSNFPLFLSHQWNQINDIWLSSMIIFPCACQFFLINYWIDKLSLNSKIFKEPIDQHLTNFYFLHKNPNKTNFLFFHRPQSINLLLKISNFHLNVVVSTFDHALKGALLTNTPASLKNRPIKLGHLSYETLLEMLQ